MRKVAQFLIRLYPANWRARYGQEFAALLEDSSPGWSAILDLLKGAIRMQLSIPTFPKLALILSVTGLLAGLLVSFMVAPIYVSQSVMALNGGVGPEYLVACEQDVLSRTSLKAIIQDPRLDLYPEERARVPLEDIIETMRTRAIRVRMETPPNTGQYRLMFSIGFAYRDPVKAQRTVQALMTRFDEVSLNHQRARAVPVNLAVLDPPRVPVALPKRSVCMFYGFVAGILAASLIAIFRRRPPPVSLLARTA